MGGTGFENPHMGHIQVALMSRAGAGEGEYDRGGGLGDLIKASAGELYRGTGLFNPCDVRVDALGKRVIFGLDFKNPA